MERRAAWVVNGPVALRVPVGPESAMQGCESRRRLADDGAAGH
jgi:hypothetical protein